MTAHKAIFFDRDGVINKSIIRDGKPYPPQTLEQFQLNPGIEDALPLFKQQGYQLFVFTNQPDVARGTQSQEQVESFHQHIMKLLPLDQVYVCFHDNADQCACRKPKPGMLLQAQKDWGVDLSQSYAIGDRWRDIDAGNAVGCQTIFVDYGYDETLQSQPDHVISCMDQLSSVIPQ